MSDFAIFGNPIQHSKSPEIYALFASEIKISSKYDLKLVSEKNFDTMLLDFFESGGKGANITVPFKERAVCLCHKLTERSMLANSVNTIKKCGNVLLGDNTDGVGFISDLKRLCWMNEDNFLIHSNSSSVKKFKPINILVIGSGGTAKGIISALLNIKRCYINIVNRTFDRAKKLVHYYYSMGYQNLSYIDYTQLSYNYNKKIYNLIINTTSSSMYNVDLKISPSLIVTRYTRCYDVFYKKHDTVFIEWCKKNGASYCADGLGMLVGQAAYSFKLWHNVFPSILPVLNYLQSTF